MALRPTVAAVSSAPLLGTWLRIAERPDRAAVGVITKVGRGS